MQDTFITDRGDEPVKTLSLSLKRTELRCKKGPRRQTSYTTYLLINQLCQRKETERKGRQTTYSTNTLKAQRMQPSM